MPGEVRLGAYSPRLNQAARTGHATRLVTLSDSTADWAAHVLPADVAGVPVTHWSWDDIRALIPANRAQVRGTERTWLDQLEDYMGAAGSAARTCHPIVQQTQELSDRGR